MPPKKHLPAPIDRPLSRAYLREFTGWSTEYPPGASDPTSLRIMENLMINRRGSVRIRPGLRSLTLMAGAGGPLSATMKMVGAHECFYLNDGRKAYLFAVNANDRVEFRVGVVEAGDSHIYVQAAISTIFDVTEWAAEIGAQPTFTSATTYVKYLQIDNKILALSNNGEPLIVFHVGATKTSPYLQSINYPVWTGSSAASNSRPLLYVPEYAWVAGSTQYATDPLPAQSFTATSLQSSTLTDNIYNFGVFYTYTNQLGESAASDVSTIRLQRPWGAWRYESLAVPGAPSEAPSPNGLPPANPEQCADILILRVPATAEGGFADAIAAGATGLNFYMFTWSDQDSVPVEAGLVASLPIGPGDTIGIEGRVALNPTNIFLGDNAILPTTANRYNSTAPSRAGNGIVAADRMVLVYDPTAAAVIKWTTNEMGNYLNFSPSKGGGFKTLTSGNMQIPATVKLWQNPQSADTLTIPNLGTDGHSTSYYMAPAQVASQSDATNIMGFEETTATPGTTSPFGVEVANNALYHPLDGELMKSTASNYNINHKSMTDMIATEWTELANKKKIVSCVHDGRLYYLVQNPDGVALPTNCNGNEVWVLDLAAEGGTWSRWLTPGVSLKKVEVLGKVLLSLIQPDGIYVFDPDYSTDDYVLAGAVAQRNIAWQLETNTQGANRAHDAWAHLQQAQLTLGNFSGTVRWGVRGWDQYGKRIEESKVTRYAVAETAARSDLEDQLRIARAMKEWFFFASSVDDEGVHRHSEGQITLVQYRYAPVSVNVGYEYGSIETFEYGRDSALAVSSFSDNGVPTPFNDQVRP